MNAGGVLPTRVAILGSRGIPAAHGGFETFAQKLALDLARRGYRVVVYCQLKGEDEDAIGPSWRGVSRRVVRTFTRGTLATIEFDLRCVVSEARRDGRVLVLGYNTAIFLVMLRALRRPVLLNMDGIEWRREKWGFFARAWLRLNEWLGARLGDRLVADHPRIKDHLDDAYGVGEKTSVIPYGADSDPSYSDILERLGLTADGFFLVIARIEPENSIAEIIEAFMSMGNDFVLVVLGSLEESNSYHRKVRSIAGRNVVFPGAIYDAGDVAALRRAARAYVHGHQVGGTNPSLVEALAAPCAVVAHDNPFNRWVAGSAQAFFSSVPDLLGVLESLCLDSGRLQSMRAAAAEQHEKRFSWKEVLAWYRVALDLPDALDGSAEIVDFTATPWDEG